MTRFDPTAIGSDVPRSGSQYLARRFAEGIVKLFGLNRPGFLSTEIVQHIHPICRIPTRVGPLSCVGGHGRLRWRAQTFYTEEPETIKWLEGIGSQGILWDIGANVGLYGIYAAMVAGCRVLAIEPEAQNYAILLENILLNRVQHLVEATNIAVTRRFGIGRLHVHALTKGGAYNQFHSHNGSSVSPDASGANPITQVQLGVALDDLIGQFGFAHPTHLKIDVDGNEPEIIEGAQQLLRNAQCRSVLIEIQRGDPRHEQIVTVLQQCGFRCVSERSNWESRANRQREREHPATNMIFTRPT